MSTGTLAVNTLKEFQFDRCFIGCVGIDINKNYSYTAEVETREVKKHCDWKFKTFLFTQ